MGPEGSPTGAGQGLALAKLKLLGNLQIKVGKESVPFFPSQGGEGGWGKSLSIPVETRDICYI